MNSALIQSRIYRGYGKAAIRLGKQCNFYRSPPSALLIGQDGTPLIGQDGSPIAGNSVTAILGEDGNPIIAQDGSALQSQPYDDVVLAQDGTPLLDQRGMLINDQTYHAPSDRNVVTGQDGTPLIGQDGQFINSQSSMSGAPSPLSNASYGTLFVSFNAEDMKYGKPNKYGKATWYALFDATNAQVGDYLVGPDGTFFIAAMQTLLPILVVECNRRVTISRPQTQAGAGIQPYGGNTQDNATPIMVNWPGSVLQGTKGEKTDPRLPSDTRAPWFNILLPYQPGANIGFGDIMTDDLEQTYVVSSSELSDLGWRCTALLTVS